MKRPGYSKARLAAVVAVAFACLAVLTLTPDAWAIPGLRPAHQTIPTRTPDRRTRRPEATPIPIPTDTELPMTPTSEPASPTPTVTGSPTPTETLQAAEAATDTPAASDAALTPSTPTAAPQEATGTAAKPAPVAVATPLATYVVITSVPTPANAATAVARAAAATALAQRDGTATPLPRHWVTPIVVTSTPTPANDATADRLTVVAYLVGLTGTPTPTPINMLTATPSPTYFVITSVPTPGNAATAVAWLEEAAARAQREGTPTPLPRNWVTPIVVTATPTPADQATADRMTVVAYLASLTGTPTPTPINMFTATPSPTYFIVTSVPTPANAATAMARAAEAAALAQREGTPTPLPRNWVTPIVVTSTPTPANDATADRLTVVAYMALLTGTPTPTRVNVFTATPSPTYFIITSVPTPGNAATAEAWLAEAAARAQREGTPTPLPRNWVTPIVVTSTPTPANQATADRLTVVAYAVSLAGTPTPTPPNLLTATPTRLTAADAIVNPTATYAPTWTPTPSALPIPVAWLGRIAFVSDREGGRPAYYVMDADGGNVQQLSGPGLYDASLARDTFDPTGQYQAFVSTPRNPDRDPDVGRNTEISLRRLSDGFEWYVTGGTKGADYEPAYCQADPRYIVYTSQQSGGDDIFVVDLLSGGRAGSELRTTRLTQNDWPWDKHPSWSPDCKQIVFYSNRDGHKQIYVMDFLGMDYPGVNPRNLSNSPYNDWDPVWFKVPPSPPGSPETQ